MPKKSLAQVFHFDSFGKRQEKYDNLTNTNFEDVAWKELNPTEPYYFFVPKDFGTQEKYNEGFSINEIFKINSIGIVTGKDSELVSLKKTELLCTNIAYRPFDFQYTTYDMKLLQRSRSRIMDNIFEKDNTVLCIGGTAKNIYSNCLVSAFIVGKHYVTSESYAFPLYLYTKKEENLFSNNSEISSEGGEIKTPNFNMEIISKIEEKLGIRADFIPDSVRTSFMLMPEDVRVGFMSAPSVMPTIILTFSPENLFDYIYAVLHSKNYRETYKEFLKIDFPKIPFDVSKDLFFEMSHLGEELRSYHLMENENLIPKNFITKYEIDGDNLVEKVGYKESPDSIESGLGSIYINDIQYFSGVPATVWEFYIGGYQPAQKWLKDRKGRNLNYEDILHYSKIILCLKETIRIMDEIEKIFKI
ncbi:hypothetical protein HGA92_02490 [Candidatus Gracilibacteria bacterium]|nr:hypothetical protein [Candidatus Gracilibacteria bacterium]NUJ99357.1 hypothetical protein [Candidatus Gracilibacteria bacterium]